MVLLEIEAERFELGAHGGRVFSEPDLEGNFACVNVGAGPGVLGRAIEGGENCGLELALEKLAFFGERNSRWEYRVLLIKGCSSLCLSRRRRWRWPWR